MLTIFSLQMNLMVCRSKCKQHGQALVYCLLVTPIILIASLLVYNTGIAVREKMSLQNTADAASYSGALVYARTLNFVAYTNRAMAANEAGIALAASLQTTFNMTNSVVSNGFTYFAYTRYLSMKEHEKAALDAFAIGNLIVTAQEDGYARSDWQLVKNLLVDSTLNAGIRPAISLPFQLAADVQRIFNYGISIGQQISYAGGLVETPLVIKDVLAHNDPAAELPPSSYLNLAAFFTECFFYTSVFWDSPLSATSLTVDDILRFMIPTGVSSNGISFGGSRTQSQHDEAMRFANSAVGAMDEFSKRRQILPDIFKPSRAMKAAMPLNWAGGTEIVSETESGDSPLGRIRWQSADRTNWNQPYMLHELLLGDNYIGALQKAIEEGGVDLISGGSASTTYILNTMNMLEGVFGLGAATASQGGPYTDNSWRGTMLQMPTAIEKPRIYGGINEANDTPYDLTRVKDPTGGVDKGALEYAYVNGIRNAAFYRSITSNDVKLYWSEDELANNLHGTDIFVKMALEPPPKGDMVGALSKWRYAPQESIGTITSNTPMPPFRDLTRHPQMMAFDSPDPVKNLKGMLSRPITGVYNLVMEASDLSDEGPSFALNVRKKAGGINFSDALLSQPKISSEPTNSQIPSFNVSMNDGTPKGYINVLSSAGVYFRRPQDRWARNDGPPAGADGVLTGVFNFGFTGGYIEHKNLFSPYWHVKNKQPWFLTRMASLVLAKTGE